MLLRLFSELGVTHAGVRHEHVDRLRRLRAGVRRRAWPVRPAALGADGRPLALPADARPRSCASTVARGALLADGSDELTVREFLAAGRFSPVLRGALHDPADRRRVVDRADPGRRLPGALPVRVPRQPRHADASPAHPPGTRSPAARRGTSSASAKGLTAVQHVHAGRARSAASPTGVEIRDDSDTVEHFDAVVIATHPEPGAGHAGRARPTPSARCSARSATRSTRPCCTPTSPCCRPRARAQASWNYRLPSCDAAPTTVNVSYNMNRLQRLDAPRDLRRDPERRRPRSTRAGSSTGWSTRTRSTRPSRSTPQQRLPELSDGDGRLRRRVPRLGLPRGRLPVRCRRRGAAWACAGDRCSAVRRRGRRTCAPTRCGTRSATRGYQWFVDLDDLPRCRAGCAAWPASRRATTSATRTATLRANVDELPRRATASTCAAGGSRCWPTPAASGYVFNPLSLFWCHDPCRRAGLRRSPRCTTPTASSTRYLLRTDDAGPRRDREGAVRLAVLPGRRLLPDERCPSPATGWPSRSRCTGPARGRSPRRCAGWPARPAPRAVVAPRCAARSRPSASARTSPSTESPCGARDCPSSPAPNRSPAHDDLPTAWPVSSARPSASNCPSGSARGTAARPARRTARCS